MNKSKTDYVINNDNTIRYTLGKYTRNPLIIFGINPSKADAEQNDNTISIVEHIAKIRKCDGYLMLNLCPLRATNINKNFFVKCNDEMFAFNLECIRERIYDSAEVVAAWGAHISDSEIFIDSLEKINDIIKEKNAKWICLSETQSGHPHHPTRLAYKNMTFEVFDMDMYIHKLKTKQIKK